MKNNKSTDPYSEFIEGVLSLPFDVRRDVLNIAERNSNNPYLYLFKRIQKQDPQDPIYGLMIENGVLTSEMLQPA